MSKYQKIETSLRGLYIVTSPFYPDSRGFFSEMYHKKEFAKMGFTKEFVQDNCSCSKRGVLRGLHFQKKYPQEKLLRVLKGRILDVVLDLRMGSESFGKYFSAELSAENQKMLYIPAGMAHGFLSLEDDTQVFYKCTDFYHPEEEAGILWNDRELAINWNLEAYQLLEENLCLSEKDKRNMTFREFCEAIEK